MRGWLRGGGLLQLTRSPIKDVARGDRGLDQRPATTDDLHTPTTLEVKRAMCRRPSEASFYRFVS
jgi:hypothetical protein